LIYIVCLSGTIVVFAQELERWEQPSGPVVTAVAPGVVDRAFAEIQPSSDKAKPNVMSVLLPSDAIPRLTLIGGSVEDGKQRWLADAEGRPVAQARHPATDFLVELHTVLHLPRLAGLAVVGLIGIALLALLISGVLAHPRIFREAFTLRWGGSKRLQEADLHNRLGTWGLPFHLMVTLTGAVLGAFLLMFGGMAATAYKGDFKGAISAIVGPLESLEDSAPAPMPRIETIMAFVRANEPSAQIQSVEVQRPGTRGQSISVIFEEAGRLSHDERYVFDGAGRMTYSSKAQPKSIGSQALLAMPSLHFGWFGGIGTKIAYGLLGLSLCVVASSGVTIWLARRRDKGRPAPVWERIWTATAWGQVSAFAFAAILPLLWSHDNAAGIGWSVASAVAYCAACFVRNANRLSVTLRLSGAFLLILLGCTHFLFWSGQSDDPMGWMVDATLAIGGCLIGAWTSRGLRAFTHEDRAKPSGSPQSI
jgi:uncharacterized iron-regulated membrane protein